MEILSPGKELNGKELKEQIPALPGYISTILCSSAVSAAELAAQSSGLQFPGGFQPPHLEGTYDPARLHNAFGSSRASPKHRASALEPHSVSFLLLRQIRVVDKLGKHRVRYRYDDDIENYRDATVLGRFA